MPPYCAYYTHPSEELARQATITIVDGATEETYGPERLTDDNPARVLRATDTNIAIQLAYAEKTPQRLLALIHSTLETTDDVRYLGDDDADWDDPAFAAVITPSGWMGAGTSRWPINTWLDLATVDGYNPLGFKNYLLDCGRSTPLAQALELGQLLAYPTIRQWEMDRSPVARRTQPVVENRTSFGVSTIYRRGTVLWSLKFGLGALEDDERAAVEEQWTDADGRARPWLWIPDATDAPCYFSRWATPDQELERMIRGMSRFSGELEEVARGLRPGV